jgi:hypothetical protein
MLHAVLWPLSSVVWYRLGKRLWLPHSPAQGVCTQFSFCSGLVLLVNTLRSQLRCHCWNYLSWPFYLDWSSQSYPLYFIILNYFLSLQEGKEVTGSIQDCILRLNPVPPFPAVPFSYHLILYASFTLVRNVLIPYYNHVCTCASLGRVTCILNVLCIHFIWSWAENVQNPLSQFQASCTLILSLSNPRSWFLSSEYCIWTTVSMFELTSKLTWSRLMAAFCPFPDNLIGLSHWPAWQETTTFHFLARWAHFLNCF